MVHAVSFDCLAIFEVTDQALIELDASDSIFRAIEIEI